MSRQSITTIKPLTFIVAPLQFFFARVYLRIGSKNCLSYTIHLLMYAFIPNTPSTLLCSYRQLDSSNDLSSQPINGHYQNKHTIIDMSKFRLIADGTGYNPWRHYHYNDFLSQITFKRATITMTKILSEPRR